MTYEIEAKYEDGRWPQEWMAEGSYDSKEEANREFERILAECKADQVKCCVRIVQLTPEVIREEGL